MSSRLSVVMAAYQAEAHVAEAIESVLGQSSPPLELIVVDDGSTDRTASVLERFGDRIRVIRQPNGGLGAARNAGLFAAKGEFVMFADADDVQLRSRAEVQVGLLERFPEAAFVFGEFSSWRDGRVIDARSLRTRKLGLGKGDFDTRIRVAFGPGHRLSALGLPGDADVFFGRVPELLATSHLAWGGVSTYRRAALVAVGGHRPGLRRYTDWDLSARLAKAYPIVFVDLPVMLYRLHEGQLSKNAELGWRSYLDVVEHVFRRDPVFYAQNKDLVTKLEAHGRAQLGGLLYERGEYAKARSELFRAIRLNPRQRRAYLELGKATVRARLGVRPNDKRYEST